MYKSECRMDIQSRLEGENRIKKSFLKGMTTELSSERQGVIQVEGDGE